MDGSTPPKTDAAPIRPDFIPASDYVSPEMLRLEKERLWPRVWQIACRLEEIPKVGDFVNYKILDESILVTRTAPDTIKAFYNTCQHRGRRLRDEESGHAGQWYCRFHGWRYNLDGEVTYVHDEGDWEGCPTFKKSELSLPQVKVDTWGGWVWINEDPNAAPLKDHLGETLIQILAPFEFENMRAAWRHTIIAPVNWKVICEAFDEGYHATATHTSGVRYSGTKSPGAAHGDHAMFFTAPDENEPMEYLEPGAENWTQATSLAEGIWAGNRHLYRTLLAMVLDPGMAAYDRLKDETPADEDPMVTLQRMVDLQHEELEKRGAPAPRSLTLETLGKAGTDWHIFPNTIVLPTIDGALWYRMRPNRDDPDSAVFDIWSFGRYAPGEEPKITRQETVGFENFRGNNPFLEEDFDNMQAVNEGMKSRGWKGARTNPLQEIQVNNFHRVLHRYIYGTTS